MPPDELISQAEWQWQPSHPPEVASIDYLRHAPAAPFPLDLPHPPARPLSPGTVEHLASLLRAFSSASSLASLAAPPPSPHPFTAAAASLSSALRSDAFSRLDALHPTLSRPLRASLAAACAALLAAHDAPRGLAWAAEQLEALAASVPDDAAFPGAYYHEIFTADVHSLREALLASRREASRRGEAAAHALEAIGTPGATVAELLAAAKAAAAARLPREAAAATAASELAGRESTLRVRLEAVEAEARELRRNVKEAEAEAQRGAARLKDSERRRAAAEAEGEATRARLQLEEETRRKVEAASVRTLQELRQLEEERWEAERKWQAEAARCAQMEREAQRASDEAAERAEELAKRLAQHAVDAASAGDKYVDSERMRVALESRVSALEQLKAQLEQQLHLERETSTQEGELRRQVEVALSKAQRATAEAQEAAAEASHGAEEARAALRNAVDAQAASEEQLRAANEKSLAQYMEQEAKEDALRQLRQLREEDQQKILRVTNERAQLEQQVRDLEERMKAAMATHDKAVDELHRQRYELQSSLTEAHRRCEDLQAAATRAEVTLQHERASGASATAADAAVGAQLDELRAEKLALSRQLSHEQSLRARGEAKAAALQREAQAAAREAQLGAARLQNAQLELQGARDELRLARGEAEAAREALRRAERERELWAGGGGRAAGGGAAPRLQPTPLQPQAPANAVAPPAKSYAIDELSRSDIWNFSAGAVARKGSGLGALPDTLPRIKSPFNTTMLLEDGSTSPYGNSVST
ncbi:hypothetical protein AB1Y20_005821 [Prymnesium parvum]|uniref:Uncharacterized protein n=1 Tax=Prymnesium parvum TaxID=97485 RepID=A0AB34J383_PRYPA